MTGTTGQWTITLTNTNAFATSVYVSDPEATLSGLPDGCEATGLPQGDATCVIPAKSGATNGTLSFTAWKVVPAAVCQLQTLSNTAKMWAGTSKGDDTDAISADGGSFPILADPEACDKPGITKVANVESTSDPSAIWWTVTVTNPATGGNGMTQNVKITDSDADVFEGPTYTGSASCTTSDFAASLNSAAGVSCTMPNSSSVSFKVKPAGDIVRTCEDQEFSNTAYLSAGTFTDSDGSTITLDKDTDCGRTLRLCKAISDNGDGIDDGGAFTFSLKVGGISIVPDVTITSHESDTNDEEGANQFPGNCITVAIPDNYRTASITVAESTAWPAGWNEAPGFPYFTTSASSETAGSSVTIDPTVTKVKFYNKNVPLEAHLTLVKIVDTTNGGDAQPDDFKLTIDGEAVTSGVSNEVTPGSHTIGETNLPGYTSGTWTCSDDTTEAGVTVTGGSITLNAGQKVTCTITNTSQKSTIVVKKVNLGGSADQDDSSSGKIGDEAFSGLTPENPVSKDVAAGTYTVSEDARTGYQYIGWNQPDEGGACETEDIKFSEGSASVSVGIGETETVCLYNQPVGTVILVKNANLPSGGTWNFTGDSPAVGARSLTTSGATPPDFSHAPETFTNVPSGAYTIAESEGRGRCQPGMGATDFETRVLASIGSEPEPGMSDVASSVTYSVEKGRTTYIVFENVACGTVLDTSSITVTKFNSLDNAPLDGWTFGITGPGIDGTRTQTTDASGSTIFLGLVDGEYTIAEVSQPGWNLVGNTFEGNESASASRSVALGLGQRKAVGFYNQPAVSIEVTKTEITNVGAHAGAGWEITLRGCGQDRTEKTGSDGTVTWNNLVPCAYTVSEDANSKGLGWIATTPTSVTVAAKDSGTYEVSFTNVYSVTPPPPTAVIEVSPTGTPTETGPTSTPTSTPTVTPAPSETAEEPVATPTVVEKTEGEKIPGLIVQTPGPGEKTVTSSATPVAPSTGSGAYGSSGGFNILLALFGLASVSAGLAVIALARKNRS